jgi:hypothetical protein
MQYDELKALKNERMIETVVSQTMKRKIENKVNGINL